VIAALPRGGFVLIAPPGAGKTTRVPPALLPHVQGEIYVLEPRRVAARAAARRVSHELRGSDRDSPTKEGSRSDPRSEQEYEREPLGQTVGYQVRFDRVGGAGTRLWVVTGGILLRKLVDDPLLDGVGAVLVDEAHERGLEVDLVLALLAEVRAARPELVVGVMSATLEAEPIARFLGDLPVLRSEGRAFPVEVDYLRHIDLRPVEDRVADGVRRALSGGDGDVLAFLPGVREIRRTAERLAGLPVEVVPLYGDLPAEAQDRALSPGASRRVVLATNVAETSVTVPGVTWVVDSGLVRQPRSDPATGLDHLDTVPISRASAEQRAGRAGRLAPGRALRLWTLREHEAMLASTLPEVQRVDLCGPVLQLLAWGSDPSTFRWLQSPSPAQIEAALGVLEDLGAFSGKNVTALGRKLAELPLHPRLGRLYVEGARLGHARAAALCAAMLAERDSQLPPAQGPLVPSPSDVLDRLERAKGARGLQRAAEQIARVRVPASGEGVSEEEALLRAVLAAWPDRVARRRPGDPTRARMVGGAGLKLDPSSAVLEPELFVAVDVTADGADARVRVASAVERAWLAVQDRTETTFDEASGSVRARRVSCYRDLPLAAHPAAVEPGQAAAVLAEVARGRLEEVLPTDVSFQNLRLRLSFLEHTQKDSSWRVDLAQLLPQLCEGCRSLQDLQRADWRGALQQELGYARWRELDRLAPTQVQVPSGRSLPLQYEPQGAPVLAVKIQEMFGLDRTPTVAGVPVKLHLLAPNGRPQQITDDLPGFWRRTWPEVRKELRARYPKHGWPEDPLTAEPMSRPRRG
jgi:ATP-dependent helicase HrpB